MTMHFAKNKGVLIMLDHQELLSDIRKELTKNVDNDYKQTVKNHFKMNIDHFLGVKTPLIRKIANQFYQSIKALPIHDILLYCDTLLERKIYEEKIIAFHWSFKAKRQYQLEHFDIFQKWLGYHVDDWIDCDDFSTHSLGYFLLAYPECCQYLEKWTVSENRWVRRASAVSLIYSLRRGQALDIAFKITDNLMQDEDYLVQKGYGWMLKEGCKHFPDQVLNYLISKKDQMPRLALRYAIEKLPKSKQELVIKK